MLELDELTDNSIVKDIDPITGNNNKECFVIVEELDLDSKVEPKIKGIAIPVEKVLEFAERQNNLQNRL